LCQHGAVILTIFEKTGIAKAETEGKFYGFSIFGPFWAHLA
jgi:hypothetical protein